MQDCLLNMFVFSVLQCLSVFCMSSISIVNKHEWMREVNFEMSRKPNQCHQLQHCLLAHRFKATRIENFSISKSDGDGVHCTATLYGRGVFVDSQYF